MQRPLVAVTYRADEASEKAIREVLDARAEVVFTSELVEEERGLLYRRADVLLSWTLGRELTSSDLQGARNLKLVQVLSAGVDHLEFASVPDSAKIASNVGAYSEPMAEHVMAMVLSLAKRLPERHAALAEGRWDQHLFSLTLCGAVCGIVGFGGIGKATARLMRPFGARIWAVNSSGRTDEEVDFVGTLGRLDVVLAGADVVVLAIPLTNVTRAMIGKRELELMKRDAILVNVARGGIVDEKALYEHLRDTPEFSAGIDTWWNEPRARAPFRAHYPFFDLHNVIGSPHNSSLVPGILVTASRRAAENVLAFLEGAPLRGLVRREDYLGL